jgi:hypothetical protein
MLLILSLFAVRCKSFGQVAQSVERGPEKAGVGGSIPSLAINLSPNLKTDRTLGFVVYANSCFQKLPANSCFRH